MRTKQQITRPLISILFLSLIWFAGKKSFEETHSAKKENQVTFTFSLPSIREMLGPTGESDLYSPELVLWVSLSGSNTLFSPKDSPDAFDFRRLGSQRNREPTPPILPKIKSRAYRKKRANYGGINLPSDTHWEEV